MPLAHSTNNYLYGKGRAYFKPEGETGYLDLGNIPKLELEVTVEIEDHFSSRSGTLEKDLSFVKQKEAKASADLEEYSPENLNLAFLGDGVQSGSQSAGYLDVEEVTPVSDRYVSLGKTDLSVLRCDHGSVADGPFVFDDTVTGGTSSATATIAWVGSGFIELVNVSGTFVVGEVITGTGTPAETATITALETKEDVVALDHATIPTVRYTAGTDYSVDVTGGLFRKLSGGSIGATCYASADYAATVNKSIRALANSEAKGELLFIGDPDQGPRWQVTGWDVAVTISGAVGFISEEISAIPIELEFQADRTNHPTEPFFRATEIS